MRFSDNDFVNNVRWGTFDYKVTMPFTKTKTSIDYLWLIKCARNWFIEKWKKLDRTCYDNTYQLYSDLAYWYFKV